MLSSENSHHLGQGAGYDDHSVTIKPSSSHQSNLHYHHHFLPDNLEKLSQRPEEKEHPYRGLRNERRRKEYLIWFITSILLIVAIFAWPWIRPELRILKRYARRWLKRYISVLDKYPMAGRCITAGIIFFSADSFSQILYTNGFALRRAVKYSVYGFALMGPLLYFWYEQMNQHGPDDDLFGSSIKALFEQFTLEPMCITLYLVYDGAVERKSVQEIMDRIKSQLFTLWVQNSVYWIPANFANYYTSVPDLRVVFANICSFWWNVYFSSAVRSQVPKTNE